MTPLQFESAYRAQWDALAHAVAEIEGKAPPADAADAVEHPLDPAQIAALYRATCEHLALARSRNYPVHLTERLDDLTARAHQIVYRPPRRGAAGLARLFLVDFPQAVRAHGACLWVATLLFTVPLVALGILTYLDPGFVLSVHDVEAVQRYDRMYDDGSEPLGRDRGADADWAMFGFYIMNNISVAFRCFAGGVFFGLGSVFFIAHNGVLAGSVAGYLTARGFGENFYSFVVTHGAFELTAIVLTGAAGLSLGRALLAPGRMTRVQALARAATAAVPLIYGVVAMLIVAAAIEAFWSSSRGVPPEVKYAVGGLCWALVLVYFTWQGRPAATRERSRAG